MSCQAVRATRYSLGSKLETESSAGNGLTEVVRYEKKCNHWPITGYLVLPAIYRIDGWFIYARSGDTSSL